MSGLMTKNDECTNRQPTSPGARCWAKIVAILMGLVLVGSSIAWGQTANAMVGIKPPDGFKASGALETFGPDTLYEKINGQAELYLSAGFVSLESQWYEAVGDANTIIEVNVYHMGSLVNAFSVFSRQRRDSAQTIDVTPLAYQTDSTVYLVHGPFYVEILSTLPPGTGHSLLMQLAEQFVRNTPVAKADLLLLDLFPPERLVKGSASMIAGDAFGFEGLDNVFLVAYDTEGGHSTAYVSRRKTAADARALVNELYRFFAQYGGTPVETTIPIEGVRMIEIMGTFEVMFSYKDYVAGVHEAPGRKQAEKIAVLLAGSLTAKP